MNAGLPPPSADKYLRRELDEIGREFYRRLEGGQLATTRCETCELSEFPPRARCPRCGDEQTWVALPLEGRLYAFTTQETALRFPAPAVLALAEVGPVTVPGICETPYERLAIGTAVRLEPRPEPETGLTILVFVPVS